LKQNVEIVANSCQSDSLAVANRTLEQPVSKNGSIAGSQFANRNAITPNKVFRELKDEEEQNCSEAPRRWDLRKEMVLEMEVKELQIRLKIEQE